MSMSRLCLFFLIAFHLCGCSGDASKPAPVDTLEAVDTGDFDVTAEVSTPVCPEGLTIWDHGGCGPIIDLCESWQLPLIGGGCVDIGARGCPLDWDPESEATCVPGTLLACPEGLVESPDGLSCEPVLDDCLDHQVPLPGGGCAAVGPAGEFADCPAGQLALLGGGCVVPGPRACPALYYPAFSGDCTAHELQECKAGYELAGDDVYCRPIWDQCGPGEVPQLGGGCEELLDAGACPVGSYAEVPAGASQVIYVDVSSDCTTACGPEKSPFKEIGLAVNQADDGAVIMIAKGEYGEGVLIDKPLSLVGLCASETVVTGTVELDGAPLAEFDRAAVVVTGAAGVSIAGLSLQSSSPGFALIDSEATLAGIEIAGAKGVGIYVAGDSNVSIQDVWVHDLKMAVMDTFEGMAVWIHKGAQVTLERVLMEKARDTAAKIAGADTSVTMIDVVIRNTNCSKNGEGGSGIRVDAKAQLVLQSTLLEGLKETGLRLKHDGTVATVKDSVIRNVAPNDNGDFGLPLAVLSSALLEASDSIFEEAAFQGLAVNGATVRLDRCVLRSTSGVSNFGNGYGIEATGSSDVTLRGCLLEDHTSLAAGAFEGSKLAVLGTVVRNTKKTPQGNGGDAFAIYGSSLSLMHSLVENNRRVAVWCNDPGSEVLIEDSCLRDTKPDSNTFGFGINASASCKLTAKRTLLDRNHRAGVAASLSATVALEDTVVRNTREVEAVGSGNGITVEAGAELSLLRCLLDNNVYAGIVSFGAKTASSLQDVIISNTQVDSVGEVGRGIQNNQGATVSLDNCVISGNTAEGISVNGEGTSLNMRGSVVRDMLDDPTGTVGLALAISDGAHVSIEDSLIFRARGSGLGIFGQYGMSPTQMELQRSVVRDTLSHENGDLGRGIQLSGGSIATINYCLFEGNRYTGAAFYDPFSQVAVHGSVFRGTVPDDAGEGGWGILVATGALVELSGSIVEGNTEQGVAVFGPESVVRLLGSVVRDNLPNSNGEHGGGLYAAQQASSLMAYALIDGNSTTGITIMNLGTSFDISHSIISNTGKGGAWTYDAANNPLEFQVYGDGLFIGDKATIDMSHSASFSNGRCGAYFFQSGGSLKDSVLWGNDSYGLALEGSQDWLAYTDGENHVFGNALGLPSTLAAQTTTSPGSLPPPPQPKIEL